MVTPEQVKKRLHSIFTPKSISLYAGVLRLKQALESKDELALQTASEKMRPWMADYAEFPSFLLEIDTAKKSSLLKRTGVNHGYSAFVNYSRVVAETLQNARLVIWFSERNERLLPAVYCPDWKTAAFVLALMGRVHVCGNPKCNEVFVPGSDKKEYCSDAHGGSYRTARSRWKTKQRSKRKQGTR